MAFGRSLIVALAVLHATALDEEDSLHRALLNDMENCQAEGPDSDCSSLELRQLRANIKVHAQEVEKSTEDLAAREKSNKNENKEKQEATSEDTVDVDSHEHEHDHAEEEEGSGCQTKVRLGEGQKCKFLESFDSCIVHGSGGFSGWGRRSFQDGDRIRNADCNLMDTNECTCNSGKCFDRRSGHCVEPNSGSSQGEKGCQNKIYLRSGQSCKFMEDMGRTCVVHGSSGGHGYGHSSGNDVVMRIDNADCDIFDNYKCKCNSGCYNRWSGRCM